MQKHYVYILASQKGGTLYIGVTKNLKRRIYEHKEKLIDGFTKTYNISQLVHYEIYDDYWNAANREARMKKWNRAWKIELIQKNNPEWTDLYDGL